ncbi:hypothetical protein QR680_011410 [Steinernema hermaphroditum]|uniref:Replication protein A OB domain-containing protein n=1 Tax=Steinernema hermaphroditum TaxID=289476 RepID=A0AA39MCA6_9BILA|nr:hypothetical protein QR680_011410 [Steinernema hermaphroditum]
MCDDPHAVEVPPLQLNVIPLNTVGAAQVHKRIDILGVVEDVGDLRQVAAQTASEPQERRDIRIVDSSNTKLQLTLWGDNAKNFNVSHGDHPMATTSSARSKYDCFFRISEELVTCRLCEKTLKKSKDGCTGNMRFHLKTDHKAEFSKFVGQQTVQKEKQEAKARADNSRQLKLPFKRTVDTNTSQ